MKKYFIIMLTLLITNHILAQEGRYYYENAVYSEDIKTVQLYRDGFELSNPLIILGEDARLILKFDDLSGDVKNYQYTFVHCDADWNESYLAQSDYLQGFADNTFTDYAFSFNTTFSYVNYQLIIPNDNIQFLASGNYALVVFEDGDKEKLVLTRRFYVAEPMVDIKGSVRRATMDAFQGENHEVDFTVYHPKLRIQNPQQQVKVVVMQNNRWDNAIRNLKPLYVRNNELVYDYNQENVFVAGNEFRYFDIRTNRLNGENVASTEFFRPYYHKTLLTDAIRSNRPYFEYREMNGKYVVESQDRVRNYDVDCDYVFVHFSLPLESILLGGSVNVFGELTQWNANKSNEMTWNFNTSRYELTMLLKQGYYNYQYVYVPQGAKVADHKNLEGSFWMTENDYQILVYFRENGGRYDRLVGFTQLNSKTDRN